MTKISLKEFQKQQRLKLRQLSRNDIIALGASGVILFAAFLSFYNGQRQLFVFQFNAYALLSLIEIICSLALLSLLLLSAGNVQARFWLALDMLGCAIWGTGEFFERLSTSATQVIFWDRITLLGCAMIPVGFYMFARLYGGKASRQRDILVPIGLLIATCSIVVFVASDETSKYLEPARQAWGLAVRPWPLLSIFSAWAGVIVVLGLARFVKHRREATTEVQRRQYDVIIVASSIALVGTMAVDVIPRTMGYNILPLGVFANITPAVGIIYAMYRYNPFAVDLSMFSDEILDTLAEAVVVTDDTFVVRMVNRRAQELTGYTSETIVGRPVIKLFGEAFVDYKTEIVRRLQQQNSAELREAQVKNAAGNALAVNFAVTKLEGDYPAYLFALSDISELKAYYTREVARTKKLEATNNAYRQQHTALQTLLAESRHLEGQLKHEKQGVEHKVEERMAEVRAERARLEASINSLDVGFLMTDKSQKIIMLNAASHSILGLPSHRTISDLAEVDRMMVEYDLTKAVTKCFASRKPVAKDNVQLGDRALRIFVAPIDDGADGILGAVILLNDISEAKALERSRDEFFSIASHELRTPLTAIRGNTQMIRAYYGEQFKEPALSEMLTDIHDSSTRLITIVNDFLDTSRLEQGKIQFKYTEFDAENLVEKVIQEFKSGEVSPKLYIKIQKPTVAHLAVRADYDRLKQVVINLISNGLKFTEKGGVTIALDSAKNKVFIRVSDTGKGIPTESQGLLFRKFQQASNNTLTRDSTRSTGLGLYISKLIVTDMKGKLFLESSILGKGSVFTIEMPAAKQSPKKGVSAHVVHKKIPKAA